MTSAGFYKDRPAIRVDTGALTALFLPEDGGKLASLKAICCCNLSERMESFS